MPNRQFLLQMAGVPGSGKSALARLIGRGAKAVVLDKDVLKTAAPEGGADGAPASGVGYATVFALARHPLGPGWSLLLDAPPCSRTIPPM